MSSDFVTPDPDIQWENQDGVNREYWVFARLCLDRLERLKMGRKLTSHRVNGLNEALEIEVLDEPGQGGACHEYVIKGIEFTPSKEASEAHRIDLPPEGFPNTEKINECRINFQNGPVLEAGYNGISQEALLAVVEDRLVSFQSGPFACRENAIALTKIQEAMMWLQKRTMDRMKRGVEGTNQK